jgi:hypothetical protein
MYSNSVHIFFKYVLCDFSYTTYSFTHTAYCTTSPHNSYTLLVLVLGKIEGEKVSNKSYEPKWRTYYKRLRDDSLLRRLTKLELSCMKIREEAYTLKPKSIFACQLLVQTYSTNCNRMCSMDSEMKHEERQTWPPHYEFILETYTMQGDRTTYRTLSPKRPPFQTGIDWWSHLQKVPRRRRISHTQPMWLWGHRLLKISSPGPVLHGTKWLLFRPHV